MIKESGENLQKIKMMRNEYMYNEKFKEAVDEYCVTNKCDIYTAFEHSSVRQMFLKYTEV